MTADPATAGAGSSSPSSGGPGRGSQGAGAGSGAVAPPLGAPPSRPPRGDAVATSPPPEAAAQRPRTTVATGAAAPGPESGSSGRTAAAPGTLAPTVPANAATAGAPSATLLGSFSTPGAAAAAAPGPAVGVPEQLVTVLAPLHAEAGVHTVSLGLQPDGLGTVQATVSVDAQQVVVSLWAGSESGHAALARALPELHDQLTLGGGHRVVVELASFGSAQPDAHSAGRHGGRRPARTSAGSTPVGTVSVAAPAPVLAGGPGPLVGTRTIDLHL